MHDETIGFIGAGQMARALAKGFVNADLTEPDRILAADALPEAVDAFCQAVPGAQIANSNGELVNSSNIVFLAIKPQNMDAVMQDIRASVDDDKLFVSIAAGIPLARLEGGLGTDRLIRVMPNTPCLVGLGASAFSRAAGASDEDGNRLQALLSAVGYAAELAEPLIDSVTGLSGSGPAYVYQIIEALCDGGVRMGLPREVALQLAAHTVQGAAAMVLQTGEPPAVLRDRVTSPGGTTIAGLQALETSGLSSALISAIAAATQRSRELGAG